VRANLFPRLAQAYRRWRDTGSLLFLRDTAQAGSAHWREAALRLLRVHEGDPAAVEAASSGWVDDPATLAL